MSRPCQGQCKGLRSTDASPAKMGRRGDGTKVLWCPCCENELVRIGVEKNAPNLTPDGRAEFVATRFECLTCEYYHVSLSNGPSKIGTGGLIT